MPSRIDIYRTAKLLIDQHGHDAATHAAMKADEMLERGDLDGQAVWMGILRAIKELTNETPIGPVN